MGKVEIAQRKGIPIPSGWAINSNGVVSTKPEEMIEGGALLPLGSDREHGGHKGYCLGVMVDMLSCVLSGANWGPFAPPFALRQEIEIPTRSVGKGIGHFFGALRIDGFIDPDDFKAQVAESSCRAVGSLQITNNGLPKGESTHPPADDAAPFRPP